jgi:dienelactone hydrolase
LAAADGTRVGAVGWLQDGRELLVLHTTADGTPAAGTAYQFGAGAWTGHDFPASVNLPTPPDGVLPGGLTVTLHEGANEPQVMIVSDGHREVALTEPDPALAGVWRALGEHLEWRDPDGATGKGLLFLPREAAAKPALPLVIQISDSLTDEKLFRPDGGGMDSGFAAQALVSQGFAVLQMDSVASERAIVLTPREGPAEVERIDAVVDMLAGRGLIDRNRVGLAGFSRSGYATYYAITHPGRTPVAAAAIFDAVTASYGAYVDEEGMGDSLDIYEMQYGTGTFWQNKAAWMDAPSFNVDRVRAPALFSATGPSSGWAMLETIGAFRYAKRPFEYRLYPHGSHLLQRPRERLEAMQATVDWMTFWLQARERPGADIDDRYERWRQLRTTWAETQAAGSGAISPVAPAR